MFHSRVIEIFFSSGDNLQNFSIFVYTKNKKELMIQLAAADSKFQG